MRSRTAIHRAFVARFHVGKLPAPVTDLQLDEIEVQLSTKLPVAYRDFMTRHGSVYTPDTLREIVKRDIDHPDIQNILEPAEAIEGTKAYWSAGMPKDVIGVGSDCMGNMIGFRRQSTRSDDATVFFFDHDFVEVHELARSFDDCLAWYVDHLKERKRATN
jgi:hypothetical protein